MIKSRLLEQIATGSATQCRSNPVSGWCLPKMGIFQISAGDYRRFRPASGQIWSLETDRQFARARHWRAFLGLLRVESLGAGLVGWRRSADRACLRMNCLLTGNFTGNSTFPGLPGSISQRKTAVPQRLSAQFPAQINREIFSRNREFFSKNREFHPRESPNEVFGTHRARVGAERMRREPSIHPFGVLCIGTPNADGGAQVGRGHHWFPRRPCVARRRYPAAACRTGSCPLDHQRVQINQMTNPIRYGVHDAADRQPAKRMADEHPPISWALPPLLCNVDLRSLVLTSNRRIWKCGFRGVSWHD
jgi:hypothetical protein